MRSTVCCAAAWAASTQHDRIAAIAHRGAHRHDCRPDKKRTQVTSPTKKSNTPSPSRSFQVTKIINAPMPDQHQ